jgi:hypothetical protein
LKNRVVQRTLIALVAALAVLAPATAASAATATARSKASTLSDWTQTSASSYNAWNTARNNRGNYPEFDWSTDYCSSSPDNPLGFDFKLSCWRHDFGYRNYKDLGTFSANKARVDSALYADLKRKCATYNVVVRPACLSLAWTYYQAVSAFGSLAAVSQADIDTAAELLP